MGPTTNGDKGERGEDGRFLPGNAGGPGNPYARKVAALRGSLINAVTHEDIEAIIHSQVEKAKQGDTVAAKFIVDRILGQPQTMDLSLVAIKARIEEMRAESDEASQKDNETVASYQLKPNAPSATNTRRSSSGGRNLDRSS